MDPNALSLHAAVALLLWAAEQGLHRAGGPGGAALVRAGWSWIATRSPPVEALDAFYGALLALDTPDPARQAALHALLHLQCYLTWTAEACAWREEGREVRGLDTPIWDITDADWQAGLELGVGAAADPAAARAELARLYARLSREAPMDPAHPAGRVWRREELGG